MDKIRYGLIGAGWRAAFFMRAARLMPDRFELCGVLCRSEERAREVAQQHEVRTFASLDALLDARPEFVVSCVSKAEMPKMTRMLLERGMPVLAETPLATDVDGLETLYAAWRQTGTPLQLAEQYFLWPTHQARRALIDRGLLGDVHHCALSDVHDYHAVSLFRHYLGEESGPVRVRANRMDFPVTATDSRAGLITTGEAGQESRVLAQLRYGDGRAALYDFSGLQYHSTIRTRHVRICGTRGEIFDDEVRYLTQDHRPRMSRLEVRRDGITGTICAVDFEGERLYESPFPADIPMTEDEIAVFDVLTRMGRMVRGGEPFYPVRHAFRDGYLSALMHAAADGDTEVISRTMPWDT